MEEALGRRFWCAAGQGVSPTPAGRTLLTHARAILRQGRAAARGLGRLRGRAPGQVKVLSNTNALTEFLPEALSSSSRRSQREHPTRGAASDEIVGSSPRASATSARGRHRGLRGAHHLSVPQRPLRAGGGARARAGAARKDRFAECSTTTSSGSTARARCSASSPARPSASDGRCGCACSCAARRGLPPGRAHVGVGIVPDNGTARRQGHGDKAIDLTDPWALRDSPSACATSRPAAVRAAAVEHMRA